MQQWRIINASSPVLMQCLVVQRRRQNKKLSEHLSKKTRAGRPCLIRNFSPIHKKQENNDKEGTRAGFSEFRPKLFSLYAFCIFRERKSEASLDGPLSQSHLAICVSSDLLTPLLIFGRKDCSIFPLVLYERQRG